jgi:hypothetical protein
MLQFFKHCRDKQGKVIWRSRKMNEGSIVTLTDLPPFKFNECCKLELWDLDNNGSDDHLGTCELRGGIRGGVHTFHFRKNGCHYALKYRIR